MRLQAVPRITKLRTTKRGLSPRTSPFENAATVQLATTDACLVVHLARNSGGFSHACAPILSAILSDERYVKAGCAVDGDLIALHDTWGEDFEATSRLDLGLIGIQQQQQQHEHHSSQDHNEHRNTRTRHGLQSLCRCLLNIDLPKPKSVAMSDWSQVPLSEDQIIYSARDAWAGAAIAQKLAEYDPETFAPSNLMLVLSEREPSIALLAKRQKRRDQAKRDLTRLLRPYRAKRHDGMPKQVHERARDLRGVIKKRILDPHLVFETNHLDFKI
jgi:hypothetical protein